jgi:methionyl-tRNA formyltransferase
MTPPPVKVLAQELGISVIQPEKLRFPEAQTCLQDWAPDLIVVAAFGQILRKNVLVLPRYGCINVHASHLPRWRGAAPIQAAILYRDTQTGATIMLMDPGVDTGPILAQQPIDILPDDNAGTLAARLYEAGANLLIQTLPGYLEGSIKAQAQDETGATYAPMLSKEDGLLDFTQPAESLERRVRAFNPWPGAFFNWQDKPLKVHRAHMAPCAGAMPPGAHAVLDHQPAIQTAQGCLVLDEVQPAGKRPMTGREFLSGAHHWAE